MQTTESADTIWITFVQQPNYGSGLCRDANGAAA
jgi:hypothetical protein